MNNKTKRNVIIIITVICLLLVVWLMIRVTKDKVYAYEGYVIEIKPSGKNQILTTINANGLSEYVIKRSTRKEFEKDKKVIAVGDYIQLNPKKRSENEVKECFVFAAYSAEGKIFNIVGDDAPYIIITTASNTLDVYKLLSPDGTIAAMPTGTTVKIYYQYEINNASEKVVADVIQPLSDIPVPLTEGEIYRIEKILDYTLTGSQTE